MKCECGAATQTQETRTVEEGIKRRRYCPSCGARFVTIETRCHTTRPTKKAGEHKARVTAPKQPAPPVQPKQPKPVAARAAVVEGSADRTSISARDRIEDMKFERSQTEYGWD